MANNPTSTLSGRVPFIHLRVGDDLQWTNSHGEVTHLGEVVEIVVDRAGTKAVQLEDGRRLTRKGWGGRVIRRRK